MIELGTTAQPLLLACYAAAVAKLTGVAIALGWDDVVMILSPDGEAIEGNQDSLTARRTDRVRCQRAGELTTPFVPAPPSGHAGCEVDAATWNKLAVFAQRTFAPATEASRLSGAGAGPWFEREQ